MKDQEPDFLTAAEVSQKLRCKLHLVHALLRSGQLESINIGSGKRPIYRVRQRAIDEFLHARTVEPKEPQSSPMEPAKPQLKKPKHLRVS